jgi:hypothetical protein
MPTLNMFEIWLVRKLVMARMQGDKLVIVPNTADCFS